MNARCAAQKAVAASITVVGSRSAFGRIGRGAELVRRNAEEVEEIGIDQRIHAEFGCFERRVGDLAAVSGLPSFAAVVTTV